LELPGGVDVADRGAAGNLNVNQDQRSKSENENDDEDEENRGMKRAKETVNVKGANAPSISMTPVARHSNAPPASMRRRLPQHKEPDCPATILFRYSDRQTIRIYEASGEGQLYRLFFARNY
jgi:hypothetical protein